MTQPIFYKDLLSGSNQYNEQDVGRKGLSLTLLVANHVPVPGFFIIRPDVFKNMISTIFQDTSVASLDEFRSKLSQTPLSPQVITSLENEYQKISGFGKAWTAVRSSVVAPLHPDVSFSGLLHTMLNVRGANDIENGLKEIYISLFQDRTYDYLKKNKISYSDISTAVIVQKMVQAEVSGIMYTVDPITLEKEHVSIEAVFGLGDVLSDGSINPDVYTVSKTSLEIIEKKIVPQDWMKVRKVGDTESLEHLQKISISKVWQYAQKLDDSLIIELTKLADKVEQALGGPQIIEWAMERGSLYVLQAKPMKNNKENPATINEVKHKITSMNDMDKFVKEAEKITFEVSDAKGSEEKIVEAVPEETLLFLGSAASSGIAYGEAVVIPSAAAMTEEMIAELKPSVNKRSIIITDEFTGTLEPLFIQAGGIVTNYGGVNSDAALTARELQIPAVVGSRIATSFLQNGALIKVDGNAGAIYRVSHLPEALPQENTESPLLERQEKSIFPTTIETQEKPLIPVSTSDDFVFPIFLTDTPTAKCVVINNPKERIPDDAQAIMIPITNGDKTEINFLKKLKANAKADLYIVISDIPSLDALLKTKRTLASNSIRRNKRIKFIISIGSIYGLLNSKNLAEIAVDGFLYDLSSLAKSYLPGSTSIDEKLWELVAGNMELVQASKLSYLGMILPKEYFTIPLRKEVLPLIKKGITSLVFSEHVPHVLEADVAELGKEMEKVQLG